MYGDRGSSPSGAIPGQRSRPGPCSRCNGIPTRWCSRLRPTTSWHAEATNHRRVHRPWGYYESVDAGERFQVKRLVVAPKGKLSLQKHLHRAEHWVVVRGTAEVTIGDKVSTVHENESVYVPIGAVHRLANPGKIPLELVEVQSGSYLGEDDIERFDDVYRRDQI